MLFCTLHASEASTLLLLGLGVVALLRKRR
ncbi:MAG: PEP-CTERM sorting domain-containing protein [Planctomycetota bacterium]